MKIDQEFSRSSQSSLSAAWRLPAALGAGSLFALIAALVADGFWDVLSLVLLALPLGGVGWALCRRKEVRRA